MGSSTKRLQYTYDARGNRHSLTDADGGRFTYGYDSRSRITNVRNPQGDRTTFSYNAVSQRTVSRLSNGTRTSFSYDAVGNLTLLANRKSDGSLISSFQYGYDKTGNRTSVLEGSGSRVTWSYDASSQLTGEYRTGSTPYRSTFTYDPAGNRTLKNEGGARTTYSYDTANQLQWSQAAAGRTTYTFDADGNQQRVLAPDGSRTTTAWDYENRTTSVQLPSGIRNTMSYEPEGLRVKLEESAGTKKFVWDEQNYLAETDGANDTQVVYTNEPQFYGNLISQRRGSTPSWYHYDGLGSTRELTDATQAVTDEKLYDAWGAVIQSSGPTVFPFQYVGNVGYYTDADQDAIYIRARIYQPSIAMWSSVDPIFWLTQPTILMSIPLGDVLLSFFSRYAYALANPVTKLDVNGLAPKDDEKNKECNKAHPMPVGPDHSKDIAGCMSQCQSKLPNWKEYQKCMYECFIKEGWGNLKSNVQEWAAKIVCCRVGYTDGNVNPCKCDDNKCKKAPDDFNNGTECSDCCKYQACLFAYKGIKGGWDGAAKGIDEAFKLNACEASCALLAMRCGDGGGIV